MAVRDNAHEQASGTGELLERETEISALERRVRELETGSGGVVVVSAPSGRGKTRLMRAAAEMACGAGFETLRAGGTKLERDLPFGVVLQLFEARWIAADEAERERLLHGPAHRAEELLTGTLDDAQLSNTNEHALIRGLFWLTANLVDGHVPRGLVALVDDAHCADPVSLRFLAYLAQRQSKLPVLLIVAVRSDELEADQQALAAIRDSAKGAVLRPARLSQDAVQAMVSAQFPDADPEFCEACLHVTSGNPRLLVALLEQVRSQQSQPDREATAKLEEMAPEAVLNTVLTLLGSMPPAARHVASAVAVLGNGASLSQVALFTGLDVEHVAEAADALSALCLFRPGAPLSFTNPLLRSAVQQSMPPLALGRAHRRAALILSAEGASEESIGTHLHASPPESDPQVVDLLRAAAQDALGNGAPERAVGLLERAIEESPPAREHPELIAELAQAELAAGLPHAVDRLDDALRLTDDTERRADLALAHGDALYDQGRYREAAEVLSGALAELGEAEPERRDRLQESYVTAATLVPDLAQLARSHGLAIVSRVAKGRVTQAQRRALSHMAIHGALHGDDRATVTELVGLAMDGGELLRDDTPEGMNWPLLTGALLYVDELERDLELCEQVVAMAGDAPAVLATASYCQTWALYRRGQIRDAAAHARAALDARPDAWTTYMRTAYAAIASCHMHCGQLAQAEKALSIIEDPGLRGTIHLPFLLETRARLRLLQHRPDDALADLQGTASLLQADFGEVSPGAVCWRSTAAFAHLALGRQAQARELAEAEYEHAERIGNTRVMMRDLRILGLAERGARGIELLERAVGLGEDYPPRLELIHALIELGAALRRANHRTASREPLLRALELSHRGGAIVLAERAQTELAASGARPRRVMLSGLESLTPSERRVGELAAKGLTTRQIAESLFVTPKTVEFHLRHIYQKLDIGSRAEIADILGEKPATG